MMTGVARRCGCGGQLVRRNIELKLQWGASGQPVRLSGVPALVCEKCGEQIVDSAVAARAQEIAREHAARRPGGTPRSRPRQGTLPYALSGR